MAAVAEAMMPLSFLKAIQVMLSLRHQVSSKVMDGAQGGTGSLLLLSDWELNPLQ